MKSILSVMMSTVCMACGAASFRVDFTPDIVTRPPVEFVRYYASNVWFKYQNYYGFAKVSRIWPGTSSPLDEAAAYCESLMCEDL